MVLVVVAMLGSAVAFEEVDNWSQWVILGAIIVTLFAYMAPRVPDPPLHRAAAKRSLCDPLHRPRACGGREVPATY